MTTDDGAAVASRMPDEAQHRDGASRSKLPIVLIAALVQGWALYGLHQAVMQVRWPATHAGWLIALYTVAVFAPLTVQMLAASLRVRPAIVLIGVWSGALFYFGWFQGAQQTESASRLIERGEFAPFAFVVGVLWLMLLPFVQLRLSAGTWRPPYGALFATAWRNKIRLTEAAAFTGLFWLLLFLWQELFDMLGIGFFEELFAQPMFVYPTTALVFGAALHLIGSIERLAGVVLDQVLSVLKWLALLAALILALFTVALVLKLPAMIASGERAIGAAWLLWLTAVTVLLVNAAFRDGGVERPYPHGVALALRCIVPLTVVVALTAVYALYLRISAYGFTIERVWACVVAAAACVYSCGYAYAARTRSPWMADVARVNVATAWFLIAVLALTLTPVLSPARIAASSQFAIALREPDVARADDRHQSPPLHYLRFRAGEYGRRKLQELAGIQDHPRAEELRTAAAAMLALENPWDRPPGDVRDALASMPMHPVDFAPDEELLALIEADLRGDLRALSADKDHAYAGVHLNLDEDTDGEFVLLTPSSAVLYERRGGAWLRAGVMQPSHQPGLEELARALAVGDVRAQTPRWRELVIGRVVFKLR